MAVTCVILYLSKRPGRGVGRWFDRSNIGASLVVVEPDQLEGKFISGEHPSLA